MSSSQKKRSRIFSTRSKKDFRPRPPTPGSQGREASLPTANWFGSQPRGRRKVARPFVANRPLSARLEASRARGAWRFDHEGNRLLIRRLVAGEARRSGVRVRKLAISATILEFEVQAPDRPALAQFFRVVAGRIPRLVTGAERGKPLSPGRKTTGRQFWDGLVATRLVDG